MIHPTADIQTKKIGENTLIWQYCVILEGATIGRNCNINYNVFIENDVSIGDNVTVKPGVQIWDGIDIKNNVFIGPNVTFTNDHVPRSKNYPETFLKTLIGEGASIGANATVLAGNDIGKFSFIGAGSVITKSVPAFTVWYGNPARQKGYITRNGILLNMNLQDKEGNFYEFKGDEPFIKRIN